MTEQPIDPLVAFVQARLVEERDWLTRARLTRADRFGKHTIHNSDLVGTIRLDCSACAGHPRVNRFLMDRLEAHEAILDRCAPLVNAVPEDDWGDSMADTVAADVLRSVLTALAAIWVEHPDHPQRPTTQGETHE
jgi:hypothetical protein